MNKKTLLKSLYCLRKGSWDMTTELNKLIDVVEKEVEENERMR